MIAGPVPTAMTRCADHLIVVIWATNPDAKVMAIASPASAGSDGETNGRGA